VFSLERSSPEHDRRSSSATLDQYDALYPLAEACSFGNGASCDSLYSQAPAGSDFRQFAATCGN